MGWSWSNTQIHFQKIVGELIKLALSVFKPECQSENSVLGAIVAGVTFCKSIVYSFLKAILDGVISVIHRVSHSTLFNEEWSITGIVGVAGCDLWRLCCCKYEKWCGVDIAAV
ncbi:uncharacterized protein LOC125876509 [Solanum stenotomum]|uniref:uncharacterized protein LOC125876509 n=1 Tax=Solanum stenotomum TaxID=172797 RepID=UPI0020D07EF5|nr:uncharacterized protein LOC125876509 [Solanum stenotomum]